MLATSWLEDFGSTLSSYVIVVSEDIFVLKKKCKILFGTSATFFNEVYGFLIIFLIEISVSLTW